jgi:hypothetical protein
MSVMPAIAFGLAGRLEVSKVVAIGEALWVLVDEAAPHLDLL